MWWALLLLGEHLGEQQCWERWKLGELDGKGTHSGEKKTKKIPPNPSPNPIGKKKIWGLPNLHVGASLSHW
jgi:hypothetical protein